LVTAIDPKDVRCVADRERLEEVVKEQASKLMGCDDESTMVQGLTLSRFSII